MTKCVNCGTEAENASYCPECGSMIIRESIAPAGSASGEPSMSDNPVTGSAPEQAPVYSSDPPQYTPAEPLGGYSGGDSASSYSGGAPAQYAPMNSYPPPPAGAYVNRPSGSGQMVFAVINIILGTVFCCCALGSGIPTLVLGIIAAVTASGANKAMTAEEAKSKLKVAMILNIIAVALILLVIVFFSVSSLFSENYLAQLSSMIEESYGQMYG